MTFEQYSKTYGSFHVPTYQITISGEDILKKHLVEVLSVTFEDAVDVSHRFSFSVNDVDSMLVDSSLFEPGKLVEVKMGYQKKLLPMMLGEITSINPSYPSSGTPQIEISGYDLLYQFTRNQRHKTWPDKTDRDVVEKILRSDHIKHKLEINTEKTAVAKKSIVQNGNDLDFIRKLAKRNCFELSINGNKVYFGPHKESQTPIVTLDYGKSLLSFNPELNIANQVSEVEVRGWDVIAKREIIGKAKSEGSKDCKNGGEIMEKLYGHVEMVVTDKPVKSQQEADALAKSIFKEKANEFIRGNAESIGIPDIRAGTPIMLKGVGKLFSRKYFIERSTHTINSSGYKTTFNVKGCTK